MITTAFFWLFSTVLLISAAAVVTSRNPVHAVLFLILAFVNAAGLFLIAGAEFLALILLVVYVGAVMVLFLFVVMMLDVDFVQLREGFQRYAPIGATVGAVLFGELVSVLAGWNRVVAASGAATPAMPQVENTRALGAVLYTDYIFLFQTSGLILLVAMIGAIVLTHRGERRGRHQDITRQQTRAVADTLVMLDVPSRQGVAASAVLRPLAAPEHLPGPAPAPAHADEVR